MRWRNTWLAAFLLFVAAASDAAAVAGAMTKEVVVADCGYVLAVPRRWRSVPVDPASTLKLRMEALPARAVVGTFMAHVLDRNGATLDMWLEHHLKSNLASMCGGFRIVSLDTVAAGCNEAKLIHATDLEAYREFGLLDALLCTSSHTIILSYSYDRTRAEEAREDMIRILASIQEAPAAAAGGGCYDMGRTKGFEDFGLFLTLPSGWLPEEKRKNKYQLEVKWPGGALNVFVFKYVPSGIVGLKRRLKKPLPGILSDETSESAAFGTSAAEAYRYKERDAADGSFKECLFGLHGRGGYALILFSQSPSDCALFRKMAKEAVLMNPAAIYSKRHETTKALRKAIREGKEDALHEALLTLVLFSDNLQVVREISKGLRVQNPDVQVECVWALERMGSEPASRALEGALNDKRVGEAARIECIRSLAAIGGEREKKVLIKYQERRPKTCSKEQLSLLYEVIASF